MGRMTLLISVTFAALVFTAQSARADDTAATGEAQGSIDFKGLSDLVYRGGGDYVLLDVRTPGEFASGHIPTAINIPLSEVGKRLPTTDKTALIILYCASGSRSAAAQRTLAELGYTNLVNFGSISRWTAEVESGE